MAKSKVQANGVALHFHHHRPNCTHYAVLLLPVSAQLAALHAESVHCMYRELTHTPRFCPLPASRSVNCVKCRDQSLCQYNMFNTRPKMYRNPDNAATRAGYAPSLAFRAIMLRADTQRSEKGFRGCSGERSPDHPRKPPSLLWVSAWRSSLDTPTRARSPP